MRVIFFGTPECSVPYLDAIAGAGGEVVAVVTQPDRPAGRGRRLCPPAVKTAALQRDLPLVQADSCREPALISQLQALQPDILLVVAFGEILCPDLLSVPRVAALNVHYSLLPAWRGAAPVQYALWRGAPETGVTLQYLARRLDAGDVVAQARVLIEDDDDAASLMFRLTVAGSDLVRRMLPQVMSGEAPRYPQDESRVTLAPPLTKLDGAIDWRETARQIINRVRAMTPWPGAFCLSDGQRLVVRRARAAADFTGHAGEPGTIVEVPRNHGPYVATGDGVVELVEIQPQGRKPMSGADYLRGARLAVGHRLLSPLPQ